MEQLRSQQMILSINHTLIPKDVHSIGARATSESINMMEHIATTPKHTDNAIFHINHLNSKKEIDAIFALSSTPD